MEKNKKKGSRFGRWINRLFFPQKEIQDIMKEEQVAGPVKTIIKNFTHKRLAMAALFIFIFILLFVVIGPYIWPIDLGYADESQKYIPPGMNMLSLPSDLVKTGIRDIAPGTTFGLGVDVNGDLYTWGHTAATGVIDLADIPEEVKNANIVHISAGDDHVVAVDDNNIVYAWGNDRLGQCTFPQEIQESNENGGTINVKQIEAGYQFTLLLTEDGYVYAWGNRSMCDIRIKDDYQGRVEKIVTTYYEHMALLDDGSVAYIGYKNDSAVRTQIPEEVMQPGTVEDICATKDSCAVVTTDGRILTWGNVATKGLDKVPQDKEGQKPVELYGGRYHYAAIYEDGEVVCWGDNTHGQCDIPESVNNGEPIATIYAGFYQNYAVTESGKVDTWGLRGYLLGTDELGRDVFTRIVHGGSVTMTVGAVAVLISLVIGVILGGLAGYFGGQVDNIIMRIAEIIGSLPFIPFAMILSSVMSNIQINGQALTTQQKMYVIMVVLGILSWTGLCRLIRAQIFAQREFEYVTAAKTMGLREGKIVFKHILPNVMSVVLVSVTLSFASSMLTESSLSYLGFGIPAPQPTWGNLLTGANNSTVIQQYWWNWVFTSLIFGITTISINLIGDGIRDAIDPKSADR
ncbi:MAG: ABC transporter permease subunit [Clostridia bacterium]|nr:ABC transporter permease subunit [Clostridia bacterium]